VRTTSKLIPMDVAARVVNAATKVPRLSDAPFAEAPTGVLEKGIHVHWALPDLFTRAVASDSHPPRFRGVPDLWLVVRFNPVSGDNKRTWRAWVLDSLTQTVSPLASWIPPDPRAETQIHTAPGVIRRVSRGWGEWDNSVRFDALTTAYYPECRKRLGFYDDLADLAGSTTGKVSYTVIGWYSRINFDPFYTEGFRRKDRVGHRADLRVNKTIHATVARTALDDLPWDVSLQSRVAPPLSRGETTKLKVDAKVQAAAVKTRASSLDGLITALPVAPTSPQHAVVDSLMPDSVKTQTVCHGSVMDVPVRAPAFSGPGSVPDDKIFLYPNVQRAMAEVASKAGEEEKIDWLDMMLGNLGQQSGSTGGVVDLPGAQHARTFQSAPGTSRFYARLEIHPPLIVATSAITVLDYTDGAPIAYSGHWPALQARSASSAVRKQAKVIPPAVLNEPPAPPAGPTDAEIVAWIAALRGHFLTARQLSGKPLDDRLIRVQDYRKNAQPTPQGRSADGLGPDQAGWWIDMGDENAPIDIVNNPLHATLAELRRSIGGARLHMPDATNVFEVPGPRWYRPWAPHLVVFGAKRSYRHGFDGRYRPDGHLTTRVSGESMIGLRVGRATVLAKDLVTSTASLAGAGLPLVASEIVQEHLLADVENAPIMARYARQPATGGVALPRLTAAQMGAASRAIWLSRGDLLKPEEKSAIDLVAPMGTPSSAAGLQVWKEWDGPLFLDTKYTHRRKRFNHAWQLPPEYVETVDRDPIVLPDREQVITERQVATVSVAKVLKKSLVTELTLDPYGKPVYKKSPPSGVDAQTFDEMDIVSASLTTLDDALFAAGERERGGFVHMNQVRLFDTFGTAMNWSSSSATLEPLPPWTVALPARLSCWGRLNFRLQSADNAAVDATPLTPPVCGVLLPDFVDQSLEVYDASGNAVGQLTADDPIRDNSAAARTLAVSFTLLPWVAKTLPAESDPTVAIENLTLRRFVQALVAQSLDVSAGATGWHETGFTAMLRVFDTVRSTLDPTFNTADTRVRLLGEPILLMNVRLAFEASGQSATELKTAPQPLSEPPALPVLHVRVGDVTRPDDGVLGCFLIGDSPSQDRFAPVSLEAAEKAVLNQMVFGASQKIEQITHPFIVNQVAEFDLAANTPFDTVVLADARGSLYATCGVLPRKTIVVPKDFIEPSLKKLEPTFQVGPVLGFERQGTLVPVVPAPRIEGMDAEFVHDDEADYPESALPPTPPLSELPAQRVRLTEGWVRMSKQKL
jgi:hypothetical protein